MTDQPQPEPQQWWGTDVRPDDDATFDSPPFVACCDAGGDAWPAPCPLHGSDNRRPKP
jgi:hypothetical protein